MNKTEREYYGMLMVKVKSGEYLDVQYEALKLRIGEVGVRCWYSVDFVCVRADGGLEFHEVKGAHVMEDARVKFEAAKRIYANLGRWIWAKKTKSKTWLIQ